MEEKLDRIIKFLEIDNLLLKEKITELENKIEENKKFIDKFYD